MTRLARMWQGIDDPTRIDHARVVMGPAGSGPGGLGPGGLGPAGLRAHGSQICDDWTLSWVLDVGSDGATRELRVDALGPGFGRRIRLRRLDDGTWDCEAEQEGGVELAAPGLADPKSVAGALDCDLGLCPMTNLMPIRRLRLAGPGAQEGSAENEESTLLMAWVDVPSLQVVPSRQIYARSSGGRVRYTSFSRDFTGELSVDENGLVIDYPQLAREIRAS